MSVDELPRMASLLPRALLHRPRASRNGTTQDENAFCIERLDRAHIARYRAALGFEGGAFPPLTYLYLLAQRAQLAMMLRPAFSERAAGLVHVMNNLIQDGPVDPDAALQLFVQARTERDEVSGAVHAEFAVSFMDRSRVLARCDSRYLAVRGAKKPRSTTAPVSEPSDPFRTWIVPRGEGRRYAALSGDYNPIHLATPLARLFGFRHAIMHGMHSVGRVSAELEQHHSRRVIGITSAFRKPIAVGATVALHHTDGGYTLWSKGQRAIEGHVTLAPSPHWPTSPTL